MHQRWRIAWNEKATASQAASTLGLRYRPKAEMFAAGVRLIGDFPHNKNNYRTDSSYDGFLTLARNKTGDIPRAALARTKTGAIPRAADDALHGSAYFPRHLRSRRAGTLSAAMVLSGQLRSFGEKKVIDSLVKMKEVFNRTDVFAFVSLVDSFAAAGLSAKLMGEGDPRTAGRIALARRARHRSLFDPLIRAAMTRLKPVAIVSFDDSDVPCLPKGPCHRMPHNRPDGHWSYMWPMFWAEQQAYHLMGAHESRVQTAYDVVVRVRPDTRLELESARLRGWRPFEQFDVHYNLDLFAILTRAAAEAYFGAANNFQNDHCASLLAYYNSSVCSPTWASQCFLRALLDSNGVRQHGNAKGFLPSMSVKLVRPNDINETSTSTVARHTWPARCSYAG
jgi:hypothetical protein